MPNGSIWHNLNNAILSLLHISYKVGFGFQKYFNLGIKGLTFAHYVRQLNIFIKTMLKMHYHII